MSHVRRRYATFSVGDIFFGIDVLQVQELIRYQEITQVPLAPPVVEGLMNLRGQIVTALDMRHKLAMPARSADCKPMNIVVRSEDGVVSLLVDDIGDVVEPPVESYEAPPETLRNEEKEIIDCVCKLERKLLLVLDIGRVLRTPAGHPRELRAETL